MRRTPEDPIPGFDLFRRGSTTILARPEVASWVHYVLTGGGTLHGDAGRDRRVIHLRGRRLVHVIPAREEGGTLHPGGTRWAVRHYARGGRVFPAILGDRYFRGGAMRPFREAAASEATRSRGISTPRVMAAAAYFSHLSYRADLVTEFVPDASDLVDALFGNVRRGPAGAADRLDALKATGRLIFSMGREGVMHPDLHAGNVLLQWQGSAPRPFLMDLDRCRVSREGATVSAEPMYRRLKSSLEKWERRTRLRLSEVEWAALQSAVAG